MQDVELLEEGLALMGLGMGFVFVFLTVLVIVTTLMSLVIRRLAPEPPAPAATPARSPAPPRQDDELMAVIGAALHRYRQRHRR
ncbi:OadG family protein [Halomonas sp. JS92-SW72]|uniref:OadG family protein n=1 Tax=Halomonas sp. JS92-SW72 TaxID=2306583 RepID=UPI000E5BB54E|nr:OadG family protein [Halomonas sp. JS92-SW72]AXY43908.1 sodium pump decarboxylase subunit gamma [Halomonas sp. JS92-SW72]